MVAVTFIFAHRGYSSKYPENTMLAFQKASEVGADGIELDVQLTKDGQVVVIHDETINRTTYNKGSVCQFTLAELKQVHKAKYFFQKDKEEIPTLKEVLEWMTQSKMLLNIELKNNVNPYVGLEEKVLDLIKDYRLMDKVIISSFNHDSIAKLSKLNTEIELAPLYNQRLFEPWNYAITLGAKGIHPKATTLTKETIEISQAAGIAVRPYTVNNPKKLLNLFQAGCEAVITDVPETAIKLWNESELGTIAD